jgi:site-specific recombinase XerD
MPATVFTARGDGANLDAANVRHVLKRILEKAELRHIRIHDLRHTLASLLIQNGESWRT